ncbi:MAG: NUDIX hydrolase [Acidobacteriota bacterium]
MRQYRLPARRYLWELPAGRLDPGETVLNAARRELREETGYRARKWKKLVSFWPSPGYVAEKMTIYLATELEAGDAMPMEDERIRTKWFTPREIERAIGTGTIADAKTILGYFLWKSSRSK